MVGLSESPHPCRKSTNLLTGLVAAGHLHAMNIWDFCMEHKGTLGTLKEE